MCVRNLLCLTCDDVGAGDQNVAKPGFDLVSVMLLPLGFYVLNDNATRDPEEIEVELVKSVREKIGEAHPAHDGSMMKRSPQSV